MIGANATVGPGDLIYLRGGTYPAYSYVNFSRSQNILSKDGTASAPIVITNYPGEIAKWNSTNTIWSLTLDGDYQKLIGTKVGSQFGIQITGGISVRTNFCRVSGVEFIGGTSNGGDLNPAMLSVPLLSGCEGLHISHNFFHNSKFVLVEKRMGCVRFFDSKNALVEYNLFKDNLELADCPVNFKDATQDAIVRYNTFINCRGGVLYFVQHHSENQHNGLDIYGNLFYGLSEEAIYFKNETGPNIRVHDNVALSLNRAFFYYLNADPIAFDTSDHGRFWNNVIDGVAFQKGWHANSNVLSSLPEFFDYNLWSTASDRTAPAGWTWPAGYFAHDVTNATLGLTYDANTMTVTAADNYPGLGVGMAGGNIGGFTWSVSSTNKPNIPRGLSVF